MEEASTWGSEELDLDSYLRRVGYEGPLTPSAGTLRSLHRAHVAAFPFENLDVLLGRPVRLDLKSLQAKMIAQRRGGYCFEQNSLFAAVLEALGFTVTGLVARVCLDSEKLRPKLHMLLRVEVGASVWLADVGFGGEGLLEPIPVSNGEPMSHQGSWTYSLAVTQRWGSQVSVLRSLRPQGWADVYTFTSEPAFVVDFEVLNHFAATHPRSPFVARPIVQRSAYDARHRLTGQVLSTIRPNGKEERRTLHAREVPNVLAEVFGIELIAADMDAVCHRCQHTVGPDSEHRGFLSQSAR